MTRRVHPDLVWGAVIGVGVAYETYGLRRDLDAALSRRTRAHFRTDTTAGRCVFAAFWIAFASWFLRHILTGP